MGSVHPSHASAPAGGQPGWKTDTNPLTEEFGDFVRATLKEWKVPGMSVAVVDGDSTYTEGYGIATFPDTPATPDTLWYAASTTKAHLAALLAHLIASEKYPALSQGWATPISSIIHDDFVLQNEWATTHLTLEDAVCHRTGMPSLDTATFRERHGKKTTPRDTARNLRNLPMTLEPRTKFLYNNHMYVVLSHVVETLTGKDLGAVLKEVIWDPLGMGATYFDLEEAQKAPNHLAGGYYWDEEKETFETAPFMEVHDSSGAGAILSSAADYAKWVKCLIHEAEPFAAETHKDIKTPRIIAGTSEAPFDIEAYGLGWQRSVFKGHVVYNHNGGMHAYGSYVYWVPELKFGLAAFSNTSATSNAAQDTVLWRLIQDKLGEPAEGRYDAGAKWRKSFKVMKEKVDQLLETVYPERADPPLPSPLGIDQLTGSYSHPGHGTMQLREEPHPSKQDEKILVADRKEMAWRFRLSFHHVSGDRWICYQSVPSSPSLFFSGGHAAKFNIGANGKVESLEIDFYNLTRGASEGKAVFGRVIS